jgi:hypothetical protein
MQNIFITPPVIVVFIAIIVTVVFLLLSKLSYKSDNNPKGKFKAYYHAAKNLLRREENQVIQDFFRLLFSLPLCTLWFYL